MKKLFNILLAVIMIMASAFSLTACAPDDEGPDGKTGLIISKDKNGTYVVRDFVYVDGCLDEDGKLDIGEVLEERNITFAKISAGAFDGDDNIKTLIVSDKIVEIEQGAFRNMKSLETLEVPFVGKNAKTDAALHQTNDAVGKATGKENTFSHFFGTTEYDDGRTMDNGYGEVYVPYTLRNVVVNATANVDYTALDKEGYAIGVNAFKNANILQSITLKGENLKEIGEGAFSGCTNIQSITLPQTIIKIYDNAFSGCTGLREVVFAEGIEVELKNSVFSGCTKINKFNSQVDSTVDLSVFSVIGEDALDFGREVEFSVRNRGEFNLDNIFGKTNYKII